MKVNVQEKLKIEQGKNLLLEKWLYSKNELPQRKLVVLVW